ncbi:5'-methylthioadenosine/S-adenosylhomocysteine nucleosidase [Mangrovibrevibacter kandeliae]|uniref:5'-methylthioadenosine/S-adenosylhomocysteine nucleosidase n=1 Tax=Mangrovibrevibacter kandeliae TaxID=2968473 RepID=UPI002118E5F4|nr:5'-methylthioadenosine/S-adenosylhomocysteine nucleosidase [Aurantimonas sp. CSK15Z-1]MCQ8782499.1 5'-methylthioadenosine/S-adenosylhomocysteine nucleosidase [Aurantimonas sp. CSK15Z-1]
MKPGSCRVALAVLALLFAWIVPATAQDAPGPARIAVVSAFEPEWTALKAAVEEPRSEEINGVEFVSGRLDGHDVVLFLSGVSMVNAAMTTQLALDRFQISTIVVSGIAGGVDPRLSIGDVVIASQWGEYLESVFARETDGGYRLPSYAQKSFANYGMMFPQPVSIRRAGDSSGDRFWLPVDPKLLAVAAQAAGAVKLARCTPEQACLDHAPQVVVGGNGVSGMAFVDNAEFRRYVADTFQARVLDMESAAVAHVAYANRVPFIAFRSLSDLAGGGEGANEMATFFGLAAGNSSALVRAFLTALPVAVVAEPKIP